jgi:hypothetical protein
VLVRFHRNDVPAELGRCGTQAGITRWLCQDDIARLRQRKDQCGDRRLRTRTDNKLSRIQMSKHRCEPFGASLAVGVASPAQVVSHQQCIICPHQYLRQTLFQHVVEVHAIRRWRGIHAQVEDRGQFDFRRRDISASSAAALQQVAASGFVVCARDRRQVDVQLCCQLALRRQTVTRFQRSVCHRRLQGIRNLQKTWPAMFTANRGNQIGKSSSCMVFNWDILSQCMEIAFK